MVLGRENFLERVKGKWIKGSSLREQPSVRSFEAIAPLEVINTVAEHLKIGSEELRRRRTRDWEGRALAMELLYRHSGLTQQEIGRWVGNLDYTAVSRERKRLRAKMEADSRVEKRLKEIEADLLS